MSSVQVDLGRMTREEVIEVAKRQNTQLKDKNNKIQDLTRALAEAQQHTPSAQLVNEKEDAIRRLKDTLHEKVTQLEQLEQKTQKWKANVMEIAQTDQATIASLKEQLHDATNTINGLREAASHHEQRTFDTENNTTINELRRELEQVRTANNALSSSVAEREADAQRKYDDLKASAIQRFRQLTEAMESMKQTLATSQSNESQQQARIDELEAALEAARSSATEREQALDQRVAELEAAVEGAHASGDREGQQQARIGELEAALATERSLEEDGAARDADEDVRLLRAQLAALVEKQEKWKGKVRCIMDSETERRQQLEASDRILTEMVEYDRHECAKTSLVLYSMTQERLALGEQIVKLQAEVVHARSDAEMLRQFHDEVMEKARSQVPW